MELDSIRKIAELTGIPLMAGANIFVTIAVIGAVQIWGGVTIHGLQAFANPWIVLIALCIYLVETLSGFSYNWLPVPVDTVKEIVKSFITIPATAALAVLIGMGDAGPQAHPVVSQAFAPDASMVLYAIMGGLLGAMPQAVKIFVRLLIDHSPEPFSNFFAEIGEGLTALIGAALVFFAPIAAIALFTLLVLVFLIVAPRMYRAAVITYEAFFAVFNRSKSDEANQAVDLTDELSEVFKKNGIAKPEYVSHVVFDKVTGIKANTKGFMVFCAKELYLIFMGKIRSKVVKIDKQSISETKKTEGFLFDYLKINVPQNTYSLKFPKNIKADFQAAAKQLNADFSNAPLKTQASEN